MRCARPRSCPASLSAAFFGSLMFGCSESGTGSLTADIIWPNQALRAESVPSQVARLQIAALDGVGGSTLAETNLYLAPEEGQLALNPLGGTWTLDEVKVGKNRAIVARAYLPPNVDPRINNLVLYEGKIENVEVRSGEINYAGPLRLTARPGVRYPPLDRDAPDAPVLTVTAVDAGEALWVNFTRPPQEDVAGYIIALSMNGRTATITRALQLDVGSPIAPGIYVAHHLRSPVPETKTVEGLTNGRAYTILVYAYDTDLDGNALNYSPADSGLGVPIDTKPPGAIDNISIVSGVTPGTAALSFTAPGEDDDLGLPRTYEVHTSTDMAALIDPAMFATLPPVQAPNVLPPGERVFDERTFADFRQTGQEPFYVGVRAIDPWENVGPIATALFSLSSTLPLEIDDLLPPMVIAGNELTIAGKHFGTAGTVSIDSGSGALPLDVVAYDDANIAVTVPANAASGTLTVRRNSDGETVSAYEVVFAKQANAFGGYTAPFELIGLDPAPGSQIAALYREVDAGSDVTGAIERIIDLSPEFLPFAALTQADRSTAIAGAYAEETQRFVFVASNADAITYASVSTSTAAAEEERTPILAQVGGADRVGLAVFPEVVPGEIPALLAFSLNGVIRTATIADLRTETIPQFFVTMPPAAGTSYDQATVARLSNSEVYLAYRETNAGVSTFGLRRNLDPFAAPDFVEIGGATHPPAGTRVELLSVPEGAGETMVLVYEAFDMANNTTDVRLLRAENFGDSAGYAPFEIEAAGRTLDDVGLVLRNGTVWIAVLAERGSSVQYTEVPITALDFDDAQRGLFRGAVLDSAGDMAVGRMGCKFVPAQVCPIAWLGTGVQVLFTRR